MNWTRDKIVETEDLMFVHLLGLPFAKETIAAAIPKTAAAVPPDAAVAATIAPPTPSPAASNDRLVFIFDVVMNFLLLLISK